MAGVVEIRCLPCVQAARVSTCFCIVLDSTESIGGAITFNHSAGHGRTITLQGTAARGGDAPVSFGPVDFGAEGVVQVIHDEARSTPPAVPRLNMTTRSRAKLGTMGGFTSLAISQPCLDHCSKPPRCGLPTGLLIAFSALPGSSSGIFA